MIEDHQIRIEEAMCMSENASKFLCLFCGIDKWFRKTLSETRQSIEYLKTSGRIASHGYRTTVLSRRAPAVSNLHQRRAHRRQSRFLYRPTRSPRSSECGPTTLWWLTTYQTIRYRWLHLCALPKCAVEAASNAFRRTD